MTKQAESIDVEDEMVETSASKTVSSKTKEKLVAIKLPSLKVHRHKVKVRGITSLICNKWSEKAIEQMRTKQMGLAKMKRGAKDPEADFESAKYKDAQGRDCVPLLGFKNAIVSAARYVEEVKMTVLRGALFVEHPEDRSQLFLPIAYERCEKREDIVRVGMGTADIRYRPEYHNWSVEFIIAMNSAMLTIEQVLNLVNLAGFSVGICEWRPERDGPHGRFEIAE